MNEFLLDIDYGFFQRLVTQCDNLKIPSITDLKQQLKQTDLIVDAIFGTVSREVISHISYNLKLKKACELDIGFSFSGKVRAPFDDVIQVIYVNMPIILINKHELIDLITRSML